METNRKEYEAYSKQVVDQFCDMLSLKNYYTDYCNAIQSKDMDTFYNFRNADERTLIDLSLSGEIENGDASDLMSERQKNAKEWLSKNYLTYDKWLLKNDQNK